MGKKNNVMCEYLARPEIFADFLNAGYFGGERKILPEELGNCGQISYDNAMQKNIGERSRDVVKVRCRGKQYMVLGIENQQMIHYAMPLRCMEYDVREYSRQLRSLKEKNRENDKENRRKNRLNVSEEKDTKLNVLDNHEFVSGMKKTDKLIPVVTLVFYHGSKKYDGCRSLHDMLDLKGENSNFLTYVADYHMNLITVDDINEEKCETGLRDLIGFLKCREDKIKMKEYCQENEERISKMDEETFDTISVMINNPQLIKKKDKYRDSKGENVNMCKAMEDWAEELKQEGKMEGKIEGKMEGKIEGKIEGKAEGVLEGIKAVIEICRELGAPKEETLLKITEKFLFTQQEAGSYIEKYWQ